MFFRLTSKFRAENVIRTQLFYAFFCSQLAQPSRSAKTFAPFFYGFALKNWRKILAAAAADAPPRLVLRCEQKKSLKNLRAFGYSC
ncbi:hypothetical protein [Campylobacter magnus]|uniref:hypothetical protein n=1 Tax=Campylobacter magnus TaxID=3026462 RepID=UPI0026DF1C7C|nr:hypothetical protein [Campylobacter magnus]MDO2407248.1 hypothetical protein [Campylobacter magnus]